MPTNTLASSFEWTDELRRVMSLTQIIALLLVENQYPKWLVAGNLRHFPRTSVDSNMSLVFVVRWTPCMGNETQRGACYCHPVLCGVCETRLWPPKHEAMLSAETAVRPLSHGLYARFKRVISCGNLWLQARMESFKKYIKKRPTIGQRSSYFQSECSSPSGSYCRFNGRPLCLVIFIRSRTQPATHASQ